MIRSLRLLYAGETPIDYPQWWRRAVLISAVLVVASISSFFVRGLKIQDDVSFTKIFNTNVCNLNDFIEEGDDYAKNN